MFGLAVPKSFVCGFINIDKKTCSSGSSCLDNFLCIGEKSVPPLCVSLENESSSENPDCLIEEEIPIKIPRKEEIYEIFKLPITYIDKSTVFHLSSVVAEDLELASSTENEPMYNHLFQPTHKFGNLLINEWKTRYTTNIPFLEDTQSILGNMESYKESIKSSDYQMNCEKILEIWDDTKNNPDFLEKYSFVEWDMLKQFNKSSSFLQILTIANLLSPIMSLIIPIIFLVFPFIILKIRGIPISFSVYIETLKDIAKHHFIGKTIMTMQSISWEKVIYFIITFGLYLMQIYQNVSMCFRFYRNVNKMNESLIEIREYTKHSILGMESFVKLHKDKETYQDFCKDVAKHSKTLKEFHTELISIRPFEHSMSKINEIGYMLKCYYELHSNQEYEDSIRFSIGYEGYINNMLGVYDNLAAQTITFAKFDQEGDLKIDEQYYPPYKNEKYISNNCNFEKNMVITGPNASGKTTLLKTTCINIIFTQQFGCGFYSNCVINPYTHIHSYLNIPDTSGRDSLFQAESRRCKEIIDIINENQEPNYRHFCIFDELYSGTNPIEATKSAYSFLVYLSKFDNVNFILTTHYVSICKKFKKSKHIRNYKMDVVFDNHGKIKYTYKMKKGISKIQGAISILEEFNYPDEIIQSVKNYKI